MDTLGGLWELAWLALRTGYHPHNAYWKWRNETAFGTEESNTLSRIERWRSILEFGRWLYRIKRGR